MAERIGRYTLLLPSRPQILGYAAVGGKKEGEGPLAREFDKINEDSHVGQDSWEKAESELMKQAISIALTKSNLTSGDIDYIFAGDLLNQCISATFGIREHAVPFLGVFSACAHMAQTTLLSAMFVDTGLATHALAATSSHFCSAERQFRMPLEYGGQRTPSSQWTVTGAGSLIVAPSEPESEGPFITAVTAGKIVDLGIKDANNMGAAMAPAACHTLTTFFNDTGRKPDDYDLILTGDLGLVGSRLLRELMEHEGQPLGSNYTDCGLLIYDFDSQKDVMSGGSGCGCSATVFCSHILNRLRSGELKKILFAATGALMSPTSTQQGESIPGIAHLLELESKC